jgi:hypothetical protein
MSSEYLKNLKVDGSDAPENNISEFDKGLRKTTKHFRQYSPGLNQVSSEQYSIELPLY